MAKTKKQKNVIARFFIRSWAILKAIYNAKDRIFYMVVAVAELGAVALLVIIKGDTAPIIARTIAVPIAMDFFNRVIVVGKAFAKAQ